MAKFTTDTEGLTAFSIGGKMIRADKDGQFDMTPEQENAARATGHIITLVEAKPTAAPTAPAPAAAPKKGTKAEPEAPTAPAADAPPPVPEV